MSMSKSDFLNLPHEPTSSTLHPTSQHTRKGNIYKYHRNHNVNSSPSPQMGLSQMLKHTDRLRDPEPPARSSKYKRLEPLPVEDAVDPKKKSPPKKGRSNPTQPTLLVDKPIPLPLSTILEHHKGTQEQNAIDSYDTNREVSTTHTNDRRHFMT